MCSIFGAVTGDLFENSPYFEIRLDTLISNSHQRGRDGRGFVQVREDRKDTTPHRSWRSCERSTKWRGLTLGYFEGASSFIGNTRAEPTTEYVKDKSPEDQQPYSLDGWHIVHNGTIANDKDLRTNRLGTSIDSAAIVEQLATYDAALDKRSVFSQVIRRLRGSFAILAVHDDHPGTVFAACNYRPIWYGAGVSYTLFASSESYLPRDLSVRMLEPYSIATFVGGRAPVIEPLLKVPAKTRSLVVCSGGLDSVVAATEAYIRGDDLELLHFQYGSRAEGPEVKAVQEVAKYLEVPYKLFPIPIYDPKDSPLLRPDAAVAGGEAGAEFAHEWVPARNLVMLAVATAYAEANGFNNIILGNNLEEAGAYPDNEPEFINRMNAVMPFAVGDGKQVRIEMPVGNLMKHEIVERGMELGAPLEHTWSCYRAGAKHCGTCGPCFMRRTAFRINGFEEVISYEDE